MVFNQDNKNKVCPVLEYRELNQHIDTVMVSAAISEAMCECGDQRMRQQGL